MDSPLRGFAHAGRGEFVYSFPYSLMAICGRTQGSPLRIPLFGSLPIAHAPSSPFSIILPQKFHFCEKIYGEIVKIA
jgi:hypothetical protein